MHFLFEPTKMGRKLDRLFGQKCPSLQRSSPYLLLFFSVFFIVQSSLTSLCNVLINFPNQLHFWLLILLLLLLLLLIIIFFASSIMGSFTHTQKLYFPSFHFSISQPNTIERNYNLFYSPYFPSSSYFQYSHFFIYPTKQTLKLDFDKNEFQLGFFFFIFFNKSPH